MVVSASPLVITSGTTTAGEGNGNYDNIYGFFKASLSSLSIFSSLVKTYLVCGRGGDDEIGNNVGVSKVVMLSFSVFSSLNVSAYTLVTISVLATRGVDNDDDDYDNNEDDGGVSE